MKAFIEKLHKESWPKGPGFSSPLKGAVLFKAVQIKPTPPLTIKCKILSKEEDNHG
jgi:hypothetical protein